MFSFPSVKSIARPPFLINTLGVEVPFCFSLETTIFLRKASFLLVYRKGLVCIFAHGENSRVAAVQPSASSSPPDCCILLFESPK